MLNDAALGFLAAFGLEKIRVSNRPSIAAVITGNEFTAKGELPESGKIFESNGSLITGFCIKNRLDHKLYHAKDNPEELKATIEKALLQSDILLVTGGVSVGDYDFTREVLEVIGFEIIFHKVAQKPGKPLLFGKMKSKAVFGLPGNPRAVWAGCHEWVYPYVQMMMGNNQPYLKKLQLPVMHDIKRKKGRTEFLAGKFNANGISVLGGQQSHMLKSALEADAIIIIPGEMDFIEKGSSLEVHLLP
jgi:molybdopterin molybdotransferase